MLTRWMVAALVVVVAFAGVAGRGPAASRVTPSARVGMNYFDGWANPVSNFHFNGLVRPDANGVFPGREPLSGWRDDSPAAMTAALEWAQADAISFFEFDWFYPPADPTLNTALANYRGLADHHGVGYSLLYVNIDPFVVPNGEWQAVVDSWAAQDFSSADYARIDGKPVVFVIDSIRFNQQWGGAAGVNAALEALRAAARAHGLPGVYVVGSVYIGTCVDRVGWDSFASQLAGESWDALTQNSYPAAACERDGAQPYQDIMAAGHTGWDRYADRLGYPTIPQVQAGWDPRPWNEAISGHLWWFERTPALFGAFVSDAASWAAAHPIPGGPVVLVNSWNELGEGQTVVPTKEDGYAYGQALAQAVGVNWSPPPKRRVAVSATKGGVLRGLTPGSSCPPRCQISVDNGTQITITAVARPGYQLRHWTGGCATEADRTCTRILDADLTARAIFLPPDTYVFTRSRRIGFASWAGDYWHASWVDPGLGLWAYADTGGKSPLYFSGEESERDAHRCAVARRQSSTRWTVWTFPTFNRLGTLVRARAGVWVVRSWTGKTVGHTEGPDGVPAGLMLLSCERSAIAALR